MGNREALLEGAIACLSEKGYAATTARDVATRAGTSLAAIGYHYGSTRTLLNEAVYVAMDRWGDQLHETMRARATPEQPYLERFAEAWRRIIDSLRQNRPVWAATLDLAAQAERVPEVRAVIGVASPLIRTGGVALFEGVDEDTVDERQARVLGSFYYALLSGVVLQWLLDPASAPSADDLVEALTEIAGRARAE
jgi:AcrR family transcriptional regulator